LLVEDVIPQRQMPPQIAVNAEHLSPRNQDTDENNDENKISEANRYWFHEVILNQKAMTWNSHRFWFYSPK
jgi:hypothetical protein